MQVDIYNQSSRTYTSPSGKEIPPKQTTALIDREASVMMIRYPRDLISPDSLRTSQVEKPDEVVALMARVNELETQLAAKPQGGKALSELQSKYDVLSKAMDEARAQIIHDQKVLAAIDPDVVAEAVALVEK